MNGGADLETFHGGMLLCCLLLVVGAIPAGAQQHAVGSAMIYRDAPEATRVHLEQDDLCFVDFEEQCLGGMMAPDWILCEFDTHPEAEWPDRCLIAVECVISDPEGNDFLGGSGMHGGMMRSEVSLTVHYDADRLGGIGIDAGSLCLARWNGTAYEVCQDAIHDTGSASFMLATYEPGGSYAVLPRATVPGSGTSWSKFKSRHVD